MSLLPQKTNPSLIAQKCRWAGLSRGHPKNRLAKYDMVRQEPVASKDSFHVCLFNSKTVEQRMCRFCNTDHGINNESTNLTAWHAVV